MEFCKIKKTRIAPSLSPKGEATPDRSRYHSSASPFGCQYRPTFPAGRRLCVYSSSMLMLNSFHFPFFPG